MAHRDILRCPYRIPYRAGLFLDAYRQHQDDYKTNIAVPFIRAAVAHYHGKAKELLAEDDSVAYEEKKLILKPLALSELFGLGDEKFQRP
ncbi:hypothetical protein AAVH_06447 [Aphelenchoides avenae]|nr:hypothetical protein AAVH_06447 [Aphelenchus avenae]